MVISVLQQKINWNKYYFRKFVKGKNSPLTAKINTSYDKINIPCWSLFYILNLPLVTRHNNCYPPKHFKTHNNQSSVVQRWDSVIEQINHYSHWISTIKIYCVIQWIVIYPMINSALHPNEQQDFYSLTYYLIRALKTTDKKCCWREASVWDNTIYSSPQKPFIKMIPHSREENCEGPFCHFPGLTKCCSANAQNPSIRIASTQ